MLNLIIPPPEFSFLFSGTQSIWESRERTWIIGDEVPLNQLSWWIVTEKNRGQDKRFIIEADRVG